MQRCSRCCRISIRGERHANGTLRRVGSHRRGEAPSPIIAAATAEASPAGLDRRLNDSIAEERELDRLPEKQARLAALPPPPPPPRASSCSFASLMMSAWITA